MFGLFRKKDPPVGGEIAYHGLSEWWLYEFSEEERDLIRKTYQPLGTGEHALDRGKVSAASGDALGFVSNLASWFTREETRHIAYKFLRKADDYSDTDMPVLSRHFAMQSRCQIFYRWREKDSGALQSAIDACERGIAISHEAAAAFRKSWDMIPAHHCFKQLAIIEEKRGNIDRAIDLCRLASADGWQGDWDARVARLERKKAKVK